MTPALPPRQPPTVRCAGARPALAAHRRTGVITVLVAQSIAECADGGRACSHTAGTAVGLVIAEDIDTLRPRTTAPGACARCIERHAT